TAFVRSPAVGAWEDDDGRVQRDDVVLLEVMAEHVHHAWWANYRKALERRFRQDEVLIRATAVEQLQATGWSARCDRLRRFAIRARRAVLRAHAKTKVLQAGDLAAVATVDLEAPDGLRGARTACSLSRCRALAWIHRVVALPGRAAQALEARHACLHMDLAVEGVAAVDRGAVHEAAAAPVTAEQREHEVTQGDELVHGSPRWVELVWPCTTRRGTGATCDGTAP